jgi:hypothetical protein
VLPPERVTTMLGRLVQTTEELNQYAIPRLTYEMLFLDLFATPPAPPPTLDLRREEIAPGPAGATGRAAAPRRTTAARRSRPEHAR